MQYIGEHPADTLLVKVYPEGRSSYSLWEDDGKSFDFEKGNIAKTRFECTDTDKETELVIFPCQGFYQGIYQSRTYDLEIHSLVKPDQILVNGSKSENWKYDSSGKVMLSVTQKNILEKQIVKIIKF